MGRSFVWRRFLSSCFGFAWICFGSREATEVASVRTCQKLPPCPIEPMPAGSKTDQALAKAISVSDSSSEMTFSGRGKIPVQ